MTSVKRCSSYRIILLSIVLAVSPFALTQNQKPAAPAPPQVSDLEKLQIENLQLKNTLLQTQQQELQKQFTELISRINQAHPGFTFNPQTMSLVAIPKPQAAGQGEKK